MTVGGTTKSITYQTSESGNLTGNPITYYNGTDYTFTWGKGTQLTSATVGDTEISYAYDMSGVRSSKTVGDVTHTYTTLSGLVMQETDGTQELYFLYDDSNQPYALVYKSSATAEPLFYYYLLNVQGDVVALMNASGAVVAEYQYDPWGVPTVKTASSAQGNDAAIVNVNPLRYRGYYYDTETGFYYLQSRYYDPAIGRFISADSFASTGQGFIGCNMFAYCNNNPVRYADQSGQMAGVDDAICLTIGFLSIAIIAAAFVVTTPPPQRSLDELGRTINSVLTNVYNTITTTLGNQPSVTAQGNSSSTANAIQKEAAKTKSKIAKERNKYHYWMAAYVDCGNGQGTFVPTIPMSFSRAISYARSGGNVFADSQRNAYKLALAAGSGRPPRSDSAHGGIGYYRHYHPNLEFRRGGHIFYI